MDETRHQWTTDAAEENDVDSPRLSPTQIVNWLVKETPLEYVKLDFPYRSVSRFIWNDPPTFSIIQATDPNGYFSHYTAMQYHGLTEQLPKSVYFNVEQPATGGGGSLSQPIEINRSSSKQNAE